MRALLICAMFSLALGIVFVDQSACIFCAADLGASASTSGNYTGFNKDCALCALGYTLPLGAPLVGFDRACEELAELLSHHTDHAFEAIFASHNLTLTVSLVSDNNIPCHSREK